MKAWFTQPENSFSSYYQYDPGTGQFVRIRLELGRNTPGDATDDTVIAYVPERVVGFSAKQMPYEDDEDADPGKYWSVNDEGQLCYNKTPLLSDPQPGYQVYDTTSPITEIHSGNPVASKAPVLPDGIAPEHLGLLANDAMISKPTAMIHLTGPDADATVLAAKIQGEVCRIVGVDDFAAITNDDIVRTLSRQIGSISDNASSGSRLTLDESLEAASNTGTQINEQIEDDLLTPTTDFENAVTSFESALSEVQTDNNNVGAQQTLTAIGDAQQAVNTAIANIDAAANTAVASELDSASKALSEAQQQATEVQAVEAQYEPLANASDIDSYEADLDLPVQQVEQFT